MSNSLPLSITAIYAVAMVAIYLWLGFQVGTARVRSGISIFHGDDKELGEKIRRHGNFVENVAFILLLLAILELNGAPAGLLHGLGIALVIARIAHPLGLHADKMKDPRRAMGAGVTAIVSLVAGGFLVWQMIA